MQRIPGRDTLYRAEQGSRGAYLRHAEVQNLIDQTVQALECEINRVWPIYRRVPLEYPSLDLDISDEPLPCPH